MRKSFGGSNRALRHCTVLRLGAAAEAKEFRVHTCNRPGLAAALGPTSHPVSRGVIGWSLEERGGGGDDPTTTAPVADHFSSGYQRAPRLTAGDFMGAVWSAAPNTQLVGLSMHWNAGAGHRAVGRPRHGTDVTVTTDRQTVLHAQSPWCTPANSGGTNLLAGDLADSSRFEMRFTCLDACTSPDAYWLQGWVLHASVRPQGRCRAGRGSRRSQRRRRHLERCHASRVQRRRPRGGPLSRQSSNSMEPRPRRWPLGSPAQCADIGPDPASPSSPPRSRAPCGSTAERSTSTPATFRRASTSSGSSSRMLRATGLRSSVRSRDDQMQTMRSGRGLIPLCVVRPTAMGPATSRGSPPTGDGGGAGRCS